MQIQSHHETLDMEINHNLIFNTKLQAIYPVFSVLLCVVLRTIWELYVIISPT